MTVKKKSPYYYFYIFLCAASYLIPVAYFFKNSVFSNLWLLYMGNGFFFFLVLISAVLTNKWADGTASLRSMLLSGIKITGLGILLICAGIFIMLMTNRSEALKNAPTSNVRGSTNGLAFDIYINAVIVNFLVGSFGAFVGAVTAKRNQKTEKGIEVT